MSELIVKVHIPAKLMKALDGNMMAVVRQSAPSIAHEIRNYLKKYPPASEANRPRSSIATRRSLSWYVRGWGTRWMSQKGRRWKDFDPPRPSKRDVSYRGYWAGVKTSEKLNRSWGIRETPQGAIVGSRASYSPLVHSHKEQADFHGERGWRTDKQAVEKVIKSGRLRRIVEMAAKRVLG